MRKITRLSLVAGASIAVIGGAMAAVPSSAATGGGECELSGTANFHPGPGTNPSGTFAYDFSGSLTNCGDSTSGPSGFGKTTGEISAGQTYTDPTGGKHAEPTATGTGSCATGTTAGIAFVHWSDGTDTVIKYTTTSAAAGVALQGSVVPSYQFADGYTVASTKYAGANADGVLAFEVTDPTQCTTANGVTSAGIDGITGLGTTS
ncbi:MAG TPA: hypothetical protein VFJ17_10495 [Mycobacteriales bacterium]|nr:hypothetical protein [Mycobacteriales bacterium]